jgi:hypothetical protein
MSDLAKLNKDIALLEECLPHWERNTRVRKVEDADIGGRSCALCREYVLGVSEECWNCPIHQKTGKEMCEGTPYAAVGDARYGSENVDELRAAAREELQFLKDLKAELEAKRDALS